MARVIIGAVVAAIAMFFIGFIFFATPLAKLSMASIDDGQAAAVQHSLAANLPGPTYWRCVCGGMDTQAQTNMFSRGPIARSNTIRRLRGDGSGVARQGRF